MASAGPAAVLASLRIADNAAGAAGNLPQARFWGVIALKEFRELGGRQMAIAKDLVK